MWTLCLLLKKIKNKDKLKLFGILAPALKHRHTQKTGCNRQHQQILTFLKVFKGNLKPIPSTCLCLIHGVFTELTLLNISVTAVATLFQLSRDNSLPPHTVNYISSIHICLLIQQPARQLPIINEMTKKTEITNSSHQLHFTVSHPPTLQQPASWIPLINNVSNS